MRTHLRKVGNSRGVIIPAAFLEACEFSEEVELHIKGKTLIIEAVKKPREHWFDGYKAEADDAWGSLAVDADTEDWEW
jgi:antitoxin MazE